MEAQPALSAQQVDSSDREPIPEPQTMGAGQAAAAAEDVLPKQRRRAGVKQRGKKLAKVCISCRLIYLIEWLC